MCVIFSGHISFGEDDWGKVYFGPTYVHHEIDREAIPHEHLLAWETIEEAEFGSFRFTHDCGGDIPEKTKETLRKVLEAWGREQWQYAQGYFKHIALEDKSPSVRANATRHITSQETLMRIATSDNSWNVRIEAIKRITDKETLSKIATEDEDWFVREVAAERIIKLNQK